MAITEKIADMMANHSQLNRKLLYRRILTDEPVGIIIDGKQIVL
ncbi:MAG TPA: hypothetical protein VEA58_00625 [Anaerovoracaceae bacterium]|nr:hypothetical protein [Anaerovoracaceae bacterium]